MSSRKITTITATKINAPQKPDARRDYAAYETWMAANFKVFQLRGYWSPEKAIAYAAAKGFMAEIIKHEDLGLMGKSWSRNTDRKFAVIKGAAVAVNS